MNDLGRLLVAMVTPMNKDLSVDYKGARELARYLVDQGCDGLVISGTTGESPTLASDEKVKLFEAIVEEIGGSATVVAGTGSYSTAESIKLTKAADDAGVDGIMLVAPYYNKPPQRGLVQHFTAIAEETKLPIIVYNVPSRTSVNIDPPTIAELAKVENIVAVKEASCNMEQVSRISMSTPESFLVYSGQDSYTLPIMAVGGYGVISVAGHVAPAMMKQMIEAFLDGEVTRASRLHLKLMPLCDALFADTSPIPVKYALSLMGLPSGGLRPPLCDISHDVGETVRDVLSRLGVMSR